MKKLILKIVVIVNVCCVLVPAVAMAETRKPGPAEALRMLKLGNVRFVSGKSKHPHTGVARLIQAGKENQENYAYATVITCSDSLVPVERIFDAGIMDIFVIRNAGNIIDVYERNSIEYGLAYVKTPVFVVLGHTQCGAVNAVTDALLDEHRTIENNISSLPEDTKSAVNQAMAQHHNLTHSLDNLLPQRGNNIPSLAENIKPAVKRAMEQHSKQINSLDDLLPQSESNIPSLLMDNIEPAVKRAMEQHSKQANSLEYLLPYVIEENVWQGINNLFIRSPAIRQMVKDGRIKVVGAIYNVGTGKIEWLPEKKVIDILFEVENPPEQQMEPLTEE